MRLGWTTDIHLNFVKATVRQRFLESLSEAADAVVISGHTHGGGEAQILDNLQVLTGEAEYGRPEIQRIIDMW